MEVEHDGIDAPPARRVDRLSEFGDGDSLRRSLAG
jgi:hypothetical protein